MLFKNQRKYEFFKDYLLYQLNSLDPTKVTQKCDIPTNIIKKDYDIFSEFLVVNFNFIILTSLFPEQLKFAEIKTKFKKDSPNDKRNYRLVLVFSLTFLKHMKDFYTIN